MEEKDIQFGSIISLPAQSFLPHFGNMVSEPLVLYELARPKEKRLKKEDKRKRFHRTKILSSDILNSQILISSILRSTILYPSILRSSTLIPSFSKRSIQFRRLDRISIRQNFKIVR